ncbi:hypothetical protein NKH18_03720 [Streptomyces sp. M10(2022)]
MVEALAHPVAGHAALVEAIGRGDGSTARDTLRCEPRQTLGQLHAL